MKPFPEYLLKNEQDMFFDTYDDLDPENDLKSSPKSKNEDISNQLSDKTTVDLELQTEMITDKMVATTIEVIFENWNCNKDF